MRRQKKILFLFFLLACVHSGKTQAIEMSAYPSGQLEAMAEKKDAEPEDDSYLMDLEQFKSHPLSLNSVSEEELLRLHILSIFQIRNFLSYRKMLGPLLSVHELQAVPGWDIETIYKLLPYVTVGREESLYSSLKERWKGGDASFIIRASQVVEKSKGYEKPSKPDASCYLGSAQKIFIRYAYNYKQLLSYGFTGEKDAGEPFFRGAQRYGFDFYSFHFFLRQSGFVRSLALGDFTVNLGQGLIQWQDFAFTKSSQSLAIKREAACLRPYHSVGEFNFHRGLGIGLQKGRWQSTLFVSFRKISTNGVADTAGRENDFSSFQTSGYHRTANEIANRNNNGQFAAGGNIRFVSRDFSLGINGVHFRFSRPLLKKDEPYNLYSLKGNQLTNYSLDYNYTLNNLHLFGEFATDHLFHKAFIQGALISLGENLDMGFIYRDISVAFQSLYSDAFTENTVPNNERGLYAGLSFRPVAGLQVNLYQDLFVFPWLKYGVDGPSGGRDFLFQLNYQPNKFCRLTGLFKQESKSTNGFAPQAGTASLMSPVKKRIRIESDFMISRSLRLSNRMEWVNITGPDDRVQRGFLGTAGIAVSRSGTSANLGATLFETDNYDTRIYSFEPDLLYSFSLPAFYGRGLHYYFNLHRDLSRLIRHSAKHFRLSAWLKWEQSFYPGSASIGTGLDEIPGDRKTEIKAEVLVQWQ